MRQLFVDHFELEKLLTKNFPRSMLDTLFLIKEQELPLVAYTSFDGDFLSHSELMKQYVLRKGKTPLNPESALGTYLVTNHYKGVKKFIIEDCLSLIDIVDEFYVMSSKIPKSVREIKHLPEGVIAEIYYWILSRERPIFFVDIGNLKTEEELLLNKKLIRYLKPTQINGIKDVANLNLVNRRDLVYLLSGEVHAKHADWMRKDAFNNKKVPLSPYTLLNHSSLYLNSDLLRINLLHRASLAIKTKEVYLYSQFPDEMFKLKNLPEDALLELYLILKFRANIKVFHKFFGEIKIPKYTNRAKWAITDHERTANES